MNSEITEARKSNMYAWIITTDLVDAPGTNLNAVGMTGSKGANPALLATLANGGGDTFQLYDDGHDCYYTGRIVGSYKGFEPLDDFGAPNAGCTGIKFIRSYDYDQTNRT